MSRFVIIETSDHIVDYSVIHECAVDSREKAVSAFHTLYGGQNGFLLFEQVAVSEPTGSRDEADDSCGEVGVQSNAEYDPVTGQRYY